MFVVRISIFAIIMALLIPVTLHAQKTDVLGGAEDAIARAKTFGDNQKFDEAVKILKRATERYPTDARVYLALANWQELRGLAAGVTDISQDARATFRHLLNQKPYSDIARDMFETYGTAIMYATDVKDIRACISELTREEFPPVLGEYGPLALPGEPTPIAFTLNDPSLPTDQRGIYQGLISSHPIPVPFVPDHQANGTTPIDQPVENISHYRLDAKYGADAKTYANEPKYAGWKFDDMLLAYAFDRDKHCWNLRFRVMWQEVPGQQESRFKLAQQIATLLLRDAALLHAYTGLTSPRFSTDGAINVWLAEKGDVGGESYNDSIYLQEVGTSRTPTEWVREISHEYSHQVFPVVGGYSQPEWGANGYMGERLFLRWLLENRLPEDPKVFGSILWLNSIDAQEVKDTRIVRVIRQYAAEGPEAPAMRASDRKAMENFIGMACYLELTRGGNYLVTELKGLTTPSYAGDGGLLMSIAEDEIHLQSIDHPTITLRLDELPLDIPLWVYLRAGVWQGIPTRTDTRPLRLTVEVDGKSVKSDETGMFFTSLLSKGWHRITLSNEGNAVPALSKLQLVRR